MTQTEFLLLVDEMLEIEPGTLKGGETLAAIPKWDSLAVLGFIVLLDQHFGLAVPATKINACVTVADLVALTGGKVTA
jgi:acyl carrier protein